MSSGLSGPCLTILDDLQAALADGEPADYTLHRVVMQIANRAETDVGSMYLIDREQGDLILAATVGLRQTCVGRLRMRRDEGLVGLVAEQRRPVNLADAASHPRFKYFPEADETRYQSFLGTPVLTGNQLRGVLVVQTINARQFTCGEVKFLTRAAGLVGLALDPILEQSPTLAKRTP